MAESVHDARLGAEEGNTPEEEATCLSPYEWLKERVKTIKYSLRHEKKFRCVDVGFGLG